MTAIKTFMVKRALPDSSPRELNCALGHPRAYEWVLVSTTRDGGFDTNARVLSTISARAVAEPNPAPSPTGNPVIAFKNYSENRDLLELLEATSIIKHTGRRLEQGLVRLEMVEVLVPQAELIRQCSGCWKWEVVGEERFKWCSKCKKIFYCSPECQKKDWKAHKYGCRVGAPPEP